MFHVHRDAESPRTDEDSAMAHESFRAGDNIGSAQFVLSQRMRHEADWLLESAADHFAPETYARAWEIKRAIQDRKFAIVENEDPASLPRTIKVAGLIFSIREY